MTDIAITTADYLEAQQTTLRDLAQARLSVAVLSRRITELERENTALRAEIAAGRAAVVDEPEPEPIRRKR